MNTQNANSDQGSVTSDQKEAFERAFRHLEPGDGGCLLPRPSWQDKRREIFQDCEWFSRITCGLLCDHRREGYCHYQPEITITEETLASLLHTYETRVTNDKKISCFEKPAAARRFANAYFKTREDAK